MSQPRRDFLKQLGSTGMLLSGVAGSALLAGEPSDLEETQRVVDAGRERTYYEPWAYGGTEAPCSDPPKADDLIKQTMVIQDYDLKTAAELGFPIGSAKIDVGRRFFLQEYMLYRDTEMPLPSQPGRQWQRVQYIRWGVSVRFTAEVTVLNAQANLSSLAALAASAEFRYATASVRFEVIGYKPSGAGSTPMAMPIPASLTVDSYVELANAVRKYQDEFLRNRTKIQPVVLGVVKTGQPPPKLDHETYITAVATGWALTQIKKGNPLAQALRIAWKDKDWEFAPPLANGRDTTSAKEIFDRQVKLVYTEVAQIKDDHSEPNELARATAEYYLVRFRVMMAG